jgi:class 3 adenylate cyclase/TolB-like protein
MSSRRLAAILFVDIAGYTALMQEDEGNALALITRFHRSLYSEVARHDGRVLKFMGDGSLCLFNSTLEAVQAAIALQMEMHQSPLVPLRVGIHTGDVLTEAEDVYGDGVNIASRLESFALPGSILVSGKVYDDLKNHKAIPAVALGRYAFKHVAEPVDVYAISSPGLTVPGRGALVGKGHKVGMNRAHLRYAFLLAAFLLLLAVAFLGYRWWGPVRTPEKNLVAIAVLPFRTESSTGDRSEFFSAGMMESVLNNLAQVKELHVISRQSAERYRDSKKPIRQIAKELGVAFILQGSVHRVGQKVKISAQLVDAKNDRYVWSSNFPGEIGDVFTLQEDIALHITEALQVNLSQEEKKRLGRVASGNQAALDPYYEAQFHYGRYAYAQPRDEKLYPVIQALCQRALRADPDLAEAYILLGKVYWIKNGDYNRNAFYHEELSDSLLLLARRVLNLDPGSPDGLILQSMYFAVSGERDRAIAQLEKVIERHPSFLSAYLQLSSIYAQVQGYHERNIQLLRKALSLDPQSLQTPMVYNLLAWAYLNILDYKKALYYSDLAKQQNLNLAEKASGQNLIALMDLHLGRVKECLQSTTELMQYDKAQALYYQAELLTNFVKDYAKAERMYRESWEANPEQAHLHRYAYVLYKLNRRKEAFALMDSSLTRIKKGSGLGRFPYHSYDVAGIYAFLGQKEEAYRILHRPAEDNMVWGWGAPNLIKVDPLFDNLRRDKEFHEIVANVHEAKRKLREKLHRLEVEGAL